MITFKTISKKIDEYSENISIKASEKIKTKDNLFSSESLNYATFFSRVRHE